MRLGVLDIGSNTAHLLVVDAHKGGAPVPANSHKTQLRLSEQMDTKGLVRQSAVDDLIEFIRAGLIFAEDLGVTEVMAFATSAIRTAANGEQVLARVAKETGVTVETLTGVEEARLTFLAVRRWFGWSAGQLLVLDIGGGSLELAQGADEYPQQALSLELGAGRLTRAFIDSDPPSPEAVRQMRRHARAEIGAVVGQLRTAAPRRAMATSKTFKQLARITGAAGSSEGPFVPRQIQRETLREWVPKLAKMTVTARAELPGVSVGRAPQLLAGAVVAEAAMDLLELPVLEVCPWALREGIILRRLDGLDD